jgi:hypothetical protein
MASDANSRARWDRVAADLRVHREAQLQAWGDIDSITLGRYLAGETTEEERRDVEAALARYPALHEVTNLVGAVLKDASISEVTSPVVQQAETTKQLPIILEPSSSRRTSLLAHKRAKAFLLPTFWKRLELVAAACVLVTIGAILFAAKLRYDNLASDAVEKPWVNQKEKSNEAAKVEQSKLDHRLSMSLLVDTPKERFFRLAKLAEEVYGEARGLVDQNEKLEQWARFYERVVGEHLIEQARQLRQEDRPIVLKEVAERLTKLESEASRFASQLTRSPRSAAAFQRIALASQKGEDNLRALTSG